jgi:putative phosphoesterase
VKETNIKTLNSALKILAMKKMQTAAVISDVHGNRWALEAVLTDIKRRDIDKIVNLGDCLYGPLDPAGTAEILMELDIPTVSGNEDRIVLDQANPHASPTLDFVQKSLTSKHIEWLEALPFSTITLDDFFLCHGTPESDMEYLLFDVEKDRISLRSTDGITSKLSSAKNKVILCGHDHTPNSVLLPDGRFIINPGSVGLQAYTDDSPYPHKIETGSPHARYSMISGSENGWRIENIAVPYHWETASETARRNGMDDWAYWLMTGRAKF